MAKRSREDFEASSPEDSETTRERESPVSSAIPPNLTDSSSLCSKIIHLDQESGEALPVTAMRCSLPPHRQTLSFSSFDEYEVHYAKAHVNRCVECRKNFPTEHFLNLHIEENHDALVSVKRDRGEQTVSLQQSTTWPVNDVNSMPALSTTVIESAQRRRNAGCILLISTFFLKTMTST